MVICFKHIAQFGVSVASFPGPHPAVLLLAVWKSGEGPRYISSREQDIIDKWLHFQSESATFCMLFNYLHVPRLACMTFSSR